MKSMSNKQYVSGRTNLAKKLSKKTAAALSMALITLFQDGINEKRNS